ncbi:MAG: three-Cys-motif partner protein TcmP [Opitutaceae bacterium]|nr:three-Cys-motif partner protein TcmP [Opitutaceae bacterium]
MTASSRDQNRELDRIGDWSVDKLAILKAYSEQYSLILQNQVVEKTNTRRFHFGYIDGFAGAGEHVHKETGIIVSGSPLNALSVAKKFDEYHFIDLDADRVARLRQLSSRTANAFVHHGDCSKVLMNDLLPRFRFEEYRRALCFLDPYGMHLRWEVLATAGKMKSIEIFLNFPVMDMNRNVKKRDINQVNPDDRARMNAFWGDETWHSKMYAQSKQDNFLGILDGHGDSTPELEKNDNEAFAAAFQARLKEVGGFKYVPRPIPMKNSRQAVVYYLFFAGNNHTGNKIVSHLFNGYR